LKAAAQVAVGLKPEEATVPDLSIDVPEGKSLIQGLFSGGTLCAEAQVVLAAAHTPVQSNAPIPGVNQITTGEDCHIILDLGDDQYTQGKPHPMIDPSVRDDIIIAALGNDKVGVVLLDVVIGYGAHNDPAGHLAEIVQAHRSSNGPAVIASVTGTEADPQVRSIQMEKLQAAGIHVAPTNADASLWALTAIQPGL
jgi:FdrA protein